MKGSCQRDRQTCHSLPATLWHNHCHLQEGEGEDVDGPFCPVENSTRGAGRCSALVGRGMQLLVLARILHVGQLLQVVDILQVGG